MKLMVSTDYSRSLDNTSIFIIALKFNPLQPPKDSNDGDTHVLRGLKETSFFFSKS